MKKSLSQAIRFGSKTMLHVIEDEETLILHRGDAVAKFKVNGSEAYLVIPKQELDSLDDRIAEIQIRSITPNILKKHGEAK